MQGAPRNICCLLLFKMSKMSYYGWLREENCLDNRQRKQ